MGDQSNCNEFIKFGVDSELYLKNQDYQKLIDESSIKSIENNVPVASTLANLTLKYAGDKRVKLAEKVIAELNKIKSGE